MKKLILALCLAFPSIAQASDIMIMDAWIPKAPSVAKSHAAYAMVHNHGTEAATLISVSAPDYMMTHIHESKVQDGVASMSMVHQIEIPAGGMLPMKHGGYHVMLMQPKTDVEVGDEIPLTFNFENGQSIKVMAVVKDAHKKSHHNHNH